MELEKTKEPLIGEIKFPHIDIDISRENLINLREYILRSSEGYDESATSDQLSNDFRLSLINRYVIVEVSSNEKINPYAIAISLEKDNLNSTRPYSIDIPFFDLLDITYTANEKLHEIYAAKDESSIKFSEDLKILFAGDPILRSLNSELEVLNKSLINGDMKNQSAIDDMELNIRSFTRAIMIHKTVLVAINY